MQSENHQLWEARTGLVPVSTLTMREAVRAFVRSVPTMSHAQKLFDAVGAQLGERGFLDPTGGPANLRWFVRDEDGWFRRRPVIQLGPGCEQVNGESGGGAGIEGHAYPSDAPEGWSGFPYSWRDEDPDPDILPAGLSRGALAVYDGSAWIELRYDERGVVRRDQTGQTATDPWTRMRHEAVRPYMVDPLQRPPGRRPISLLCRPDLDPAGHPIDELARMIVEQGGDRDPVRVWMPALVQGGIEGTWWRSMVVLKRLFWEGVVPPEARRVVIDSFDGTAVAWGDTLEEATSCWEQEVWRVKPRPPVEPDFPDDLPDETEMETEGEETIDPETGIRTLPLMRATIVMRAPVITPWPTAIPENVPAVLVTLPPFPAEVPEVWRAHGFTHWRRVIGERGEVGHVLVRPDSETGFTIVGEGIVDAVDPATLDGQMDAETARTRADWPRAFGEPPWVKLEYPFESVFFTAWDPARRAPAALKSMSQSWGVRLEPVALDGDGLPWLVVRMRYLR